MDEIRIRERAPADFQRCVEALAVVHRLDAYPVNWPADPYRWLCRPDAPDAWIAERSDGVIVGHLALHPVTAPVGDASRSPIAEVSRLFVVPAARRQAVASRLLRQAREWAAEHGYGLILEVRDERSPAVALYERTGWRYTGTSTATWTGPDGEPVTVRHYSLRSGRCGR